MFCHFEMHSDEIVEAGDDYLTEDVDLTVCRQGELLGVGGAAMHA